ncbi:MAG: hypothetical protein LBS37_06030 [Treponema sp.]|jgi:hypothetical protein|nr:hypothetical protein [Treponema sp.]
MKTFKDIYLSSLKEEIEDRNDLGHLNESKSDEEKTFEDIYLSSLKEIGIIPSR